MAGDKIDVSFEINADAEKVQNNLFVMGHIKGQNLHP